MITAATSPRASSRREVGGIVGADNGGEHPERLGDADRRARSSLGVEVRAHGVGPPVKVILELDDAIAARRRSRHAQREHHRLGAGRGETNLLGRRDQRRDQLRPLDLERMGGAVVRPARHLLLHGRDDRRVRVAEEQRAVAHRVVDQLGAVDEPLPRAARSRDVDARIVGARRVRGAAGEHLSRPLRQIGVSARVHSLGHGHAEEDTRHLEATGSEALKSTDEAHHRPGPTAGVRTGGGGGCVSGPRNFDSSEPMLPGGPLSPRQLLSEDLPSRPGSASCLARVPQPSCFSSRWWWRDCRR